MPNKKSSAQSIKAAIPFFALLGGNGFASQRVNSISLNSSKFAKKPVVYIDNLEATNVKFETVEKTKRKSPFAAFTNQSIAKPQNAEIKTQSNALDFLQKNNLLSPTKIKSSKTSGNLTTRKTLTDDWNWNTRGNTGNSNCVGGATWLGNAASGFNWYSNYTSHPTITYYGCVLVLTNFGQITYRDSNKNNILANCQALHMACDAAPLPVELEKFEVE